eukprot:scaffold155200_cov24-Tisochrysis_lutea.AAC.1
MQWVGAQCCTCPQRVISAEPVLCTSSFVAIERAKWSPSCFDASSIMPPPGRLGDHLQPLWPCR